MCQSGCVLEVLDSMLADKGLMMPLDLGAKGRYYCFDCMGENLYEVCGQVLKSPYLKLLIYLWLYTVL